MTPISLSDDSGCSRDGTARSSPTPFGFLRVGRSHMTAAGSLSAAALVALARELVETRAFPVKLQMTTSAAVALVPCRWASIVVTAHLSTHPPELASSTDPQLGARIADIAANSGSSPGIHAFERGELVHCPDLSTEVRFREYAESMVAQTPVRSALSLPILIHDATAGVLTLYAAQPDSFDASAVQRAYLLTEQAAVAIAAALNRDRAEHLQVALGSSRTIGTAIGVLVERFRIPPGAAFEKLRAASQNSNRKLSDIAEELVETGTLAGDQGDALNLS